MVLDNNGGGYPIGLSGGRSFQGRVVVGVQLFVFVFDQRYFVVVRFPGVECTVAFTFVEGYDGFVAIELFGIEASFGERLALRASLVAFSYFFRFTVGVGFVTFSTWYTSPFLS